MKLSLAVRTSATTAASASLEIIAPPLQPMVVWEITATNVNATASIIGVGRPAAAGITPTSPVTFLANNPADTPLGTTALAWGTGPTVPAKFYARQAMAAAVGAEAIFTGPYFIAAGASLVVWIIATASVQDINVKASIGGSSF